MRGIIRSKSGEIYVTKNRPEAVGYDYLHGDLATGGEITLPRENVEAVEFYYDYQIETFRLRLKELGR